MRLYKQLKSNYKYTNISHGLKDLLSTEAVHAQLGAIPDLRGESTGGYHSELRQKEIVGEKRRQYAVSVTKCKAKYFIRESTITWISSKVSVVSHQNSQIMLW